MRPWICPGANTQGATLEEARANLHEAVAVRETPSAGSTSSNDAKDLYCSPPFRNQRRFGSKRRRLSAEGNRPESAPPTCHRQIAQDVANRDARASNARLTKSDGRIRSDSVEQVHRRSLPVDLSLAKFGSRANRDVVAFRIRLNTAGPRLDRPARTRGRVVRDGDRRVGRESGRESLVGPAIVANEPRAVPSSAARMRRVGSIRWFDGPHLHKSSGCIV